MPQQSLAKQWLAGAIAGSCEALVTMPLEVLKTRLQVAGGGKWSVVFRRDIALRDAFVGLSPQLLQTSMKVGIRFVSFEQLKLYLPTGAAGFGAGAIESLIWIAPTERLKILMISNNGLHKSLKDTFIVTIRSQGIQGLWRGGTATVARNSLTVGLRFWMVDQMKPFIAIVIPSNPVMQTGGAGFLAGVFSTVLNQPIDVVKTRMSADQIGNDKPRYRSNISCAYQVWQEGGLRAYYAGCTARIAKISIGQAVIFSVYELASKVI